MAVDWERAIHTPYVALAIGYFTSRKPSYADLKKKWMPDFLYYMTLKTIRHVSLYGEDPGIKRMVDARKPGRMRKRRILLAAHDRRWK